MQHHCKKSYNCFAGISETPVRNFTCMQSWYFVDSSPSINARGPSPVLGVTPTGHWQGAARHVFAHSVSKTSQVARFSSSASRVCDSGSVGHTAPPASGDLSIANCFPIFAGSQELGHSLPKWIRLH